MNVQCNTCQRNTKDFLTYDHFVMKLGKEKKLKICTYCNNSKGRGWIFINRFRRWIDPEVIEYIVNQNPEGVKISDLTLEKISKPLIFLTHIKRDGTPMKNCNKKTMLMTLQEKKKLTAKLGKQKFNTAVKNERKADYWQDWDSFDFKDDNLPLAFI